MSAHTPGPWMHATAGATMRGYSQPFAIAEHGKSNLIAGCFGDVKGGEEVAEANARLISAAPDLLEAGVTLCDAVERYLNDDDDGSVGALRNAQDKWRAAIKKALGS